MGDDTLVGAGISPKERLERIEALLEKIDDKLDTKADRALVDQVDIRVRMIESMGTEQARATAGKVEALGNQVASIRTKIWAFGIIAATLFAVAGGVAGVVVNIF